MRDKIVAGNWKMNNDLNDGFKLTSEIVHIIKDEVADDVKVILAPPFIHLTAIHKLLEDERISLAAQNCHQEPEGAYTGEVSASMIKSTGAEYVILGHSERRQYFKEKDDLLAKKINIALENELIPIFCCGEPLEVRESGDQEKYVTNQITSSLFHLDESGFDKLVIAYEPIWAIGTGKNASADQAQEMHKCIRDHIASKYGQVLADSTSILYGGSCKPSNAPELFAGEDVDGGLIGGASLKSRDFVDIVKSF